MSASNVQSVSPDMERVLNMLKVTTKLQKTVPNRALTTEQLEVKMFLSNFVYTMMREIIDHGIVEEKMQLRFLDQVRQIKDYVQGILCSRSFLERQTHLFQHLPLYLYPFNDNLKRELEEYKYSATYIAAMRTVVNY